MGAPTLNDAGDLPPGWPPGPFAPRPPGEWRAGGAQRVPRPSEHRVVDRGPWPQRPITVAEVAAAVRAHRPADVRPYAAESRPSAVLVVLRDAPDGADVLLTKRSAGLRNHRGEISFPGGRVDPGESFEQTARREAHEEVGLDPQCVRIVGRLDALNTVVSRSFIVPVVATLIGDDRPLLAPVTAEVDAVFWTPLGELVRPDTFREEQWGRPPQDRTLHFFELDDETVWGATARVLTQLLRLVLG